SETEPVTEVQTEAASETEPITEAQTEAALETEPVTEVQTEATSETESVTEAQTEASPETELITEAPIEAASETEPVTETETAQALEPITPSDYLVENIDDYIIVDTLDNLNVVWNSDEEVEKWISKTENCIWWEETYEDSHVAEEGDSVSVQMEVLNEETGTLTSITTRLELGDVLSYGEDVHRALTGVQTGDTISFETVYNTAYVYSTVEDDGTRTEIYDTVRYEGIEAENGQTLTFEITVLAIGNTHWGYEEGYTDEYAQYYGYADMQEYKEALKSWLRESYEEDSYKEILIAAAMDEAAVTGIPDTLYSTCESEYNNGFRFGIDSNGFLCWCGDNEANWVTGTEETGVLADDIQSALSDETGKRLLISYICEKNHLEISEEEYVQYVENYASEWGSGAYEFEQDMTRSWLVWSLYEEKAAEFLYQSAVITETDNSSQFETEAVTEMAEDTNGESETNLNEAAQAEEEMTPETGVVTDETEPETQLDTENMEEQTAEAEVSAETESAAETEAEVSAETEPAVETETEASPEAELIAEIAVEAETAAPAESEAAAEAETEAWTETVITSYLGTYTVAGTDSVSAYPKAKEADSNLTLRPNTTVVVLKTKEKSGTEWAKIFYYGYKGWVKLSELTELSTENQMPSLETVRYVNCDSSGTLAVHETAASDGTVLAELSYGTEIQIVQYKKAWGLITVEVTAEDGTAANVTGWVDMTQVSVFIPEVYYYVHTQSGSGANLRETADSSSAQVGSLAQGTTVTITECQNGWGKTTVDGVEGWISMTLMTPCAESDGGDIVKAAVTDTGSTSSGSSTYSSGSSGSSSSGSSSSGSSWSSIEWDWG
ncbi:MAG: SH3 domain-containing protein, partial [Lachnospiraceae bacterium]|nr:SH3 domain-containing protein [Lachnospiraceae bacterium]